MVFMVFVFKSAFVGIKPLLECAAGQPHARIRVDVGVGVLNCGSVGHH